MFSKKWLSKKKNNFKVCKKLGNVNSFKSDWYILFLCYIKKVFIMSFVFLNVKQDAGKVETREVRLKGWWNGWKLYGRTHSDGSDDRNLLMIVRSLFFSGKQTKKGFWQFLAFEFG